eukprot:symbB.v1.2.033041.t1/scaffold4051.1/size47670/2
MERYFGEQQIPIRYTRDICFVRLRKCKGQVFEEHCKADSKGAFLDDLQPWRHTHLQGQEVIPEQTFPPHYEHDAVLAAKLVNFFHAEQRHAGRPLKVVDLGCGRGTLVLELRQWRLLAVGLDANPLLTATINAYGMVADLTHNLSFTIKTANPRCAFRPHPGRWAPGFEFEDAGQSAEIKFHGDPSKLDLSNPTAWLNWINFVSSRCCAQLACVGFDTRGKLKWHLPRSDKWKSTNQVWVYEKYQFVPPHDEAHVQCPFEHGPGTLIPVKSGGKTMDWVISLDVGEHIPSHLQAKFLVNVAQLANEGIIISWGKTSESHIEHEHNIATLVSMGFQRDQNFEKELRLFAGIGLRPHLRHTLYALRHVKRSKVRWGCALQPVTPNIYCEPEITFGCLDRKRIWARGLCNGNFRRQHHEFLSKPLVAHCRLLTSSLHEYEECELPEPPAISREPAPKMPDWALNSAGPFSKSNYMPSFDCMSENVPVQDFWRLHGISINAAFDSADPLVRNDEPIWSGESCGVLAMGFKLIRLIEAPRAHFISEIKKVWTGEVYFLFKKWAWQLSPNCWLASLLSGASRLLRRYLPPFTQGIEPKRSRLRANVGLLHRCAWSYRRVRKLKRCQAAVGYVRHSLSRVANDQPFGRILEASESLWRVLSLESSSKAPCFVMSPSFRRYVQRLLALPY